MANTEHHPTVHCNVLSLFWQMEGCSFASVISNTILLINYVIYLPIKWYEGKSESISNIHVKINKTAIYNSQAHHFSIRSPSFSIHLAQCCKSLCISLEKNSDWAASCVWPSTHGHWQNDYLLKDLWRVQKMKIWQGYMMYVPVSQSIAAGVLPKVWAEYGEHCHLCFL